MRNWKSSPEFKERMGRVQKHIDEFAPTELELVASCTSGAAVSTETRTLILGGGFGALP